jgi:hypothetical protein
MIVPVWKRLFDCANGSHRGCRLAFYSDGIPNICNCECHNHGLLLRQFVEWNHFWLVDKSLSTHLVIARGGESPKVREVVYYTSAKCARLDNHFHCMEVVHTEHEQFLCACSCHTRPIWGFCGNMGHYFKARKVLNGEAVSERYPFDRTL